MAFDPNSAQPTQQSSFNPASAQLAGQPSFDSGSAAPADTEGATPDWLKPQPKESWSNVVPGLHGAYMQGVTSGLFMQPIRAAMEASGYGMDRVKQLYPGMSDEFYKGKLHQLYGQAVDSARRQAQQETASHPYPGHQIGNFAAGVVASPEMLLAPGAGVGATALARIGSAAVLNAGIGSASDAAAQVMDMAEGQKKDFDITQNLTTAATSGLIGGGMHGVSEAAPVVSDFMKGLYKNRGMDTTPPADPRGTTTPMTGDSVSMTPEDQAHFKLLLKHGNVDDIKQFLATKQGPKPTWQQVDQMVQFRDSMPENFTGQDNFNQAIDSTINDHQRQLVSDHIDAQTANWKNKPDVEVVHGPHDIEDPKVRQEALEQGAADPDNPAMGLFGSDGKVRVFSGQTSGPEAVNSVLYHEALGHYGLQQQFGAGLNSTLNTLIERNVGRFGDDVADRMKANPGGSRLLAAEEVLAERSQKGPLKPALKDAIVAKLRQFGRRMGLDLSYSDNEIQHILAMAHDAVINGKGGDVRSNGYRGIKQGGSTPNSKWLNMDGPVDHNKFMFTGKKATGFDPNSATAFTASDGSVRNEISDRYAELNPNIPRDRRLRLEDVLMHHDLFEEYPQLKDVSVIHTDMDPKLDGSYNPKTRRMYLNTSAPNKLSTVLHETQHAIQGFEDYPGVRGADTMNMSEEDYANSPIEKEARATEQRASMGHGDRANTPSRFMTRSQLAASPGHMSERLEDIYKSLDENYVPSTKSWDEQQHDALALGFPVSQIKKLRGTDGLSTLMWRMQSAANMADQKIAALESELGTASWNMDKQATYLQTLADSNYLNTRIRGSNSEIARALQVAKAFPSYNLSTMKAVAERLREEGSGLASLAEDPTKFMKFALDIKQLRESGNPAAARVKMQQVNKPYWEQYLNTFHFNAMLSALSTHVKAPMDMGTGVMRNVLEKVVAMPVGWTRQAIEGMAGQKVVPGVTSNELAMHTYGLIRPFLDLEVTRQMAHAVKTGEGSYVAPDGSVTKTNVANSYGATSNPDIPGVSIPSHLIAAQDTFFRSHEINGQMYGLAARKAAVEMGKGAWDKLSWDDKNTIASNYARDPDLQMIRAARSGSSWDDLLDSSSAARSKELREKRGFVEEAEDQTNRTLLLNSNPINKLLDRYRVYRPGMNPGERIMNFIVGNIAPFIRVESNSLFNRVIQRSPLAILDPYTQSQFRAGGAKADIAMAKIIYGSVSIGMAWNAASAAKNYLTGKGPDNANKRQELEAGGWTPQSVHEGGRFNQSNSLAMSVFPWDQHNSTATMVAGLREAMESGANKGQVGQGFKLALAATFHDLADMTWISDIAPYTEAATTDGAAGVGKIARAVGNEASTWVPNILNQGQRLADPNMHDTRTEDPTDITGNIANAVGSKLPGVASSFPTRYSVYGDPVQNGASVTGVHTWLTHGNGRAETTDPAEQELERLGSVMNGGKALVTPMRDTITVDDPSKFDAKQITQNANGTSNVKLSRAQFEEYQHLVGRNIVEHVRQEMNTPEWQKMSDNDKAWEVKDIEKDMRKAVKEHLYGQ